MELITDILNALPGYIEALATVVGGFAMLAALTSTKRDDSIVGKLSKIIDFLGANFINAKNK